VQETDDFLSKWGDSGTIDICEALSDLIILTASRCLHGDDVREELFAEASTSAHHDAVRYSGSGVQEPVSYGRLRRFH
jgi:hypothetical protein